MENKHPMKKTWLGILTALLVLGCGSTGGGSAGGAQTASGPPPGSGGGHVEFDLPAGRGLAMPDESVLAYTKCKLAGKNETEPRSFDLACCGGTKSVRARQDGDKVRVDCHAATNDDCKALVDMLGGNAPKEWGACLATGETAGACADAKKCCATLTGPWQIGCKNLVEPGKANDCAQFLQDARKNSQCP